MKNTYGNMMNSAYGKYYERFKAANALSKKTAVKIDVLFPEGQNPVDVSRMHKMLSAGIVKREGSNRYWLDEKMASDPKRVLKQRLLVIAAGIGLAVILVLLDKFGIISL